MYYRDKLGSLRGIFGTDDLALEAQALRVGARRYPIVDDVIVLLGPDEYPPQLRVRMAVAERTSRREDFSETVQRGFGNEWRAFPKILPEHEEEFRAYFDLVDLRSLQDARVCDLGCGIGRWSYFLAPHCRELVLVDFSEAIFVARENLRGIDKALFFLGDLRALPLREKFCDFLFSLGVLHHLPTDALEETRRIARYCRGPLLVYLYYALDNRPAYFRWILKGVTALRLALSRLQNPALRSAAVWALALGVYAPLAALGRALSPLGLDRHVPLAETYRGKGLERVRQDVYDRFFTAIEQRVGREEILALRDTFSDVVVSDRPPYWHFLCTP